MSSWISMVFFVSIWNGDTWRRTKYTMRSRNHILLFYPWRLVPRPSTFVRSALSSFVSYCLSHMSPYGVPWRLPQPKLICEYLFKGLHAPLHIMGQDSCDVIKYRGSWNKLSILKVKGTNKDLFFKPLDKLFKSQNSKFSSSNTIIVDDSRE
jgi:hypothetical protein